MKSNLIENRQIRVFISSTFRDMQDERDELLKKTFPLLRRKAAERDVTLTEIDLRWGITEEESKSGKVVEICLREIENSVPFFIGIIGNRYGWVPGRGDVGGATERFAEVDGYLDKGISVTEMEMQFGVLSRPEDMHAFFYIKEQEEDGVENMDMLRRLKDEVMESRYPSSTYHDVEDLGRQVEDAFCRLLDEVFPEGCLSEVERERVGHRSFLNQLSQTYVRDEHNFEVIDRWCEGDGGILTVTGASGLGKSALVANWVREKLLDDSFGRNIIYHFTGGGGSESDYHDVVRRLINEIRDAYGYDDSDDAGAQAEEVLDMLCLRIDNDPDAPGLVIAIDGVNQIADDAPQDAPSPKDLEWVPLASRKVKLLFTTLENDRTMQALREMRDVGGAPSEVFVLQPLDHGRRTELVNAYLLKYSKTLLPRQVERIVSDGQCCNTLVLKTVLDELVNFGIFEQLDAKIELYLGAETVPEFYQIFLQSYENDFGRSLVQDALSLIAVSREGLSEKELLGLLGVSQLGWSQLYCSLNAHVNVKGGRINFSHSYISSAVRMRYLADDECRSRYRLRLLDFFEDDYSPEAVREFTCQATSLAAFERLRRYVCQRDVVRYLLDGERGELKRLWTVLFDAGELPLLEWDDTDVSVDAALSLIAFMRRLRGDAIEMGRRGDYEPSQADYIIIDGVKRADEHFCSLLAHYEEVARAKGDAALVMRICAVMGDFEKYYAAAQMAYGKGSALLADDIYEHRDAFGSGKLDNPAVEEAEALYGALGLRDGVLKCIKHPVLLHMARCKDEFRPALFMKWIGYVRDEFAPGSREHIECIQTINTALACRSSKERPAKGTDDLFEAMAVLEAGMSADDAADSLVAPEEVRWRRRSDDRGCGVRSVTIPEGVTEIEDEAFRGFTSLVEVRIPESVLQIGESAFEGCSRLERVVIPNAYADIGMYAFKDCISLREVVLPENLSYIEEGTFEGCLHLQHIELPAGLKSIGESAFYDCEALSEVAVPDSVREISAAAFSCCSGLGRIDVSGLDYIEPSTFLGCYRLREVKVSPNLMGVGMMAFLFCIQLRDIHVPYDAEIGEYAFLGTSVSIESTDDDKEYTLKDGVAVIKDGVTYVGAGFFEDEDEGEIRELVIPDSVTRIKSLYGLDCLESAFIPDSVKEIGFKDEGARLPLFSSNRLVSVRLPEGIAEIQDCMFQDCSALESVNIPDSVRRIGKEAFRGCEALKELLIPDSVEAIGERAFEGCENLNIALSPENNAFALDGGILVCGGEIVWISPDVKNQECICLPRGVRNIAESQFAGLESLHGIEIPDSVTSIGDSAFECSGLTRCEIPDSVTSIGESAFMSCEMLESVKLPASLEKVGWRQFMMCSSLRCVAIPGSVTEIGYEAFSSCSSLECVDLPDSVKRIGQSAFSCCEHLSCLSLSGSVEEIRSGAFGECTALKKVDIPASARRICSNAFYGCTGLSVSVPATVGEIEEDAFCDVRELRLGFTSIDDLEIAVDCSSEPWKTVLIVPQGTEQMYREHKYFCQFKEIREG